MLEPQEASATIGDIEIGEGIVLEKTISESDVYGFAGITGDLAPNHINERYMKGSIYGTRIAQGALILGFTSAASAMYSVRRGINGVAAGYDRVRFVGPVKFGDTIRIEYRIARIDRERQRTHAEVTITNQDGDVVLVCDHLMKFLPYGDEARGPAA